MQTLLGTSADVHEPSANTDAVVGYTGADGLSHGITGVAWSYNAAPTNGNLKIEDDDNTILSIDITAAGPGVIYFDPAKTISEEQDLTVTLSAGGASVTGKVSVLGHFLK